MTRGQKKGSKRATSKETVGTKQVQQQVKAKPQGAGGADSTGYENSWLNAVAHRLGLKGKRGKTQVGGSVGKGTGKSSRGKTRGNSAKGIGRVSTSSSSRPSPPPSSSNGGAGGSWWSRWWRKQTSIQLQQKQKQQQQQQQKQRTQTQQQRGKGTSSRTPASGSTNRGTKGHVRAPLPRRHGLPSKPPPSSGSGSTSKGGRTSGSVKPTIKTNASGAGNSSRGSSKQTGATPRGNRVNVTEPVVAVMERSAVDTLVQVHKRAR